MADGSAMTADSRPTSTVDVMRMQRVFVAYIKSLGITLHLEDT